MKIEIRKATVADLPALLPLVTRYHAFEHVEMSDSDRTQAVSALLKDSSAGDIWLIEHARRCIGYVAICVGYSIEFAGYDAFVDEFFIDEAYRRQGIGSQALEFVKQAAQQRGIRALHLEVARDNALARSLYAKSGFRPREKFVLMSASLVARKEPKE